MNNILKSIALIIALIGHSSLCVAQEKGEYNEWLSVTAAMNWSSGLLTAEGFGVAPEGKREQVGALLACRAAVADAQRNLLEATKGVKVTVETSIKRLAAEYDTVKSAVEGTVRGAAILEREMVDSITCKVVMGIFVGDDLTKSVYQKSIVENNSAAVLWDAFWDNSFLASLNVSNFSLISSAVAQEMPVEDILSNEFERLDQRVSKLETSILTITPELAQARVEDQPSGLIIDVRGQRFTPSMTPELRKPNGEVIYPSAQDKQSLIASGKLLSLFSRSLEFAMNHPVVGDKPLLIKAGVVNGQPSNISLNKQNAERLGALAGTSFFESPKIIIVLD